MLSLLACVQCSATLITCRSKVLSVEYSVSLNLDMQVDRIHLQEIVVTAFPVLLLRSTGGICK